MPWLELELELCDELELGLDAVGVEGVEGVEGVLAQPPSSAQLRPAATLARRLPRRSARLSTWIAVRIGFIASHSLLYEPALLKSLSLPSRK